MRHFRWKDITPESVAAQVCGVAVEQDNSEVEPRASLMSEIEVQQLKLNYAQVRGRWERAKSELLRLRAELVSATAEREAADTELVDTLDRTGRSPVNAVTALAQATRRVNMTTREIASVTTAEASAAVECEKTMAAIIGLMGR